MNGFDEVIEKRPYLPGRSDSPVPSQSPPDYISMQNLEREQTKKRSKASSTKSRRHILREKFVEWSKISTSHGYPRIFQSEYMVLKCVWAVLTCVSTGFATYLVYRAIQGYLEYDVTSKIRLVNELPADCKTISINKLKKSFLRGLKILFSSS
jgi:hypothetical protein